MSHFIGEAIFFLALAFSFTMAAISYWAVYRDKAPRWLIGICIAQGVFSGALSICHKIIQWLAS